jgi:hypothetical protein
MDPLTTPDSQDGFMDEVDPATFLMVIRGNTASGKSTTATTLRQRIGGMYPLVLQLAVDGVPVTVTLGAPPAKSEACGGTGIALFQTSLLPVERKPRLATRLGRCSRHQRRLRCASRRPGVRLPFHRRRAETGGLDGGLEPGLAVVFPAAAVECIREETWPAR